MSHLVSKTINYRFMYSKFARVSSINTDTLMKEGYKYIWVEKGNNISSVSKDVPEGSNFNTAFGGIELSDYDLYSKNKNYYTPGGSSGDISSTDSPRAYTYNGNLVGKSMEYDKTYYLWFKRGAPPNTWEKSQFYIVFKDKDWTSLNSSTLTFVIKDKANVEP